MRKSLEEMDDCVLQEQKLRWMAEALSSSADLHWAQFQLGRIIDEQLRRMAVVGTTLQPPNGLEGT